MHPSLIKYSHKIRTRVCGIAIQNNKLLLVKHKGMINTDFFWSFPGGGLEYGEKTSDALKREMLEECNLSVSIIQFLFVNEYLRVPLHAIELYFEIKIEGGNLALGSDPEHEEQILEDIKWMSFEEINALDPQNKHSILSKCHSVESLLALEGSFLK